MLSIDKGLSYNAIKALEKGAIIGIITILIYVVVVIITTPSGPVLYHKCIRNPIKRRINFDKINHMVIVTQPSGII